MAFTPAVLTPDPEPWFVKELALIDRSLRVVWGYERYLKHRWMIERRMSPERYALAYASVLKADSPRIIQQPIYDIERPIKDVLDGQEVTMGYEIIGYRDFDLAPEFEWIKTIETESGDFKPPGRDDLLDLRRQYAWNYTHPISRAKFEEDERKKQEAKERDADTAMKEAFLEAYDQMWSETGGRVTAKPQAEIMKGTEI